MRYDLGEHVNMYKKNTLSLQGVYIEQGIHLLKGLALGWMLRMKMKIVV